MKRLLAIDTNDPCVRTLTPAEAEGSDALVCVPWSNPPILADNARGLCEQCWITLQFRPDAPKRPMKLCCECAGKWVRPH